MDVCFTSEIVHERALAYRVNIDIAALESQPHPIDRSNLDIFLQKRNSKSVSEGQSILTRSLANASGYQKFTALSNVVSGQRVLIANVHHATGDYWMGPAWSSLTFDFDQPAFPVVFGSGFD